VLITLGAKGAEAHHAGGCLWVPAVPVAVVDTVGAGDTFNAGIRHGLSLAGVRRRAALRALEDETLIRALTAFPPAGRV